MADLNVSIQAGLVPILRAGELFYGSGNPSSPNGGDMRQFFNTTTKRASWYIYNGESEEWEIDTVSANPQASDAYYTYRNTTRNQPTSNLGFFHNDDNDLSTLGRAKNIPIARLLEAGDGEFGEVSIGSGRRNVSILNVGKYGLENAYLSNQQTITYGDGIDSITGTSIENIFTFDRDVWCDTIIMKLSGILKKARTRIYDNTTDDIIYDSTNDIDWSNDIEQNPDFNWPDGQVIALVAEREFRLKANTEYRMVRNVAEEITAYGVQDGEDFIPYLGLITYDVESAYIVNRDHMVQREISENTSSEELVCNDLDLIVPTSMDGQISMTVSVDTLRFRVIDVVKLLGGGDSIYIDFGGGITATLSVQGDDVDFFNIDGTWYYKNYRLGGGSGEV